MPVAIKDIKESDVIIHNVGTKLNDFNEKPFRSSVAVLCMADFMDITLK